MTHSADTTTVGPPVGIPQPHREHSGGERLFFPDIPRLELDQLLEQLLGRADDVLDTQDRLRGLLRANAAVTAQLELPSLLRHIVDAARDLLRARYAAIVVRGCDGRWEQFASAGMDDDLVTSIRPAHGPGALDSLIADPDADAPPQPDGELLDVPIRDGNDVIGTLYLRAVKGTPFSADDRELVTALAATAGVALAHARLLAESERRRGWLDASSRLTNTLLTTATATGAPLSCVLLAAMAAADADFATFSEAIEGDRYRVTAAEGNSGSLGRIAALHGSAVGRTIVAGTQVLVAQHPSGPSEPGVEADDGGPAIIFPLSAGVPIRGAVTIGRDPGRAGFTGADLDMAGAFGTHAAVALALAESRDAQITDARLEDHDRIAFDLHDHVIGQLFAIGMGLQGLGTATRNPVHSLKLDKYIDGLDQVISTIRTTIFQLQSGRHDPMGLQSRVLEVAEAHTDQLGYAPQVHFTGPLDLLVDDDLAVDVLAVTREALSNCARHAHASTVSVAVAVAGERLTVNVTDNGAGMGAPTRSSGLTSLRRRAEKHGGTFVVTAPDDGGTRLTWSAACHRTAAAG